MSGEKINGTIVIPYSKTGDRSQDEVMLNGYCEIFYNLLSPFDPTDTITAIYLPSTSSREADTS